MISVVFLVIAMWLIPRMLLLGLSSPPKNDAGHWNLLRIRWDAGLACVSGYAAWAVWLRSHIVGSTAIVAAVLLICDAWCDLLTSIGHSDQWVTLRTACCGEIPLEAFFLWSYRRIVLNTLGTLYHLVGGGPPPSRLHQAETLSLLVRPRRRDPSESGYGGYNP